MVNDWTSLAEADENGKLFFPEYVHVMLLDTLLIKMSLTIFFLLLIFFCW